MVVGMVVRVRMMILNILMLTIILMVIMKILVMAINGRGNISTKTNVYTNTSNDDSDVDKGAKNAILMVIII